MPDMAFGYPYPILNAHFPKISEIIEKCSMVQLSIFAEICQEKTWKTGTVRTTDYVRFVCCA